MSQATSCLAMMRKVGDCSTFSKLATQHFVALQAARTGCNSITRAIVFGNLHWKILLCCKLQENCLLMALTCNVCFLQLSIESGQAMWQSRRPGEGYYAKQPHSGKSTVTVCLFVVNKVNQDYCANWGHVHCKYCFLGIYPTHSKSSGYQNHFTIRIRVGTGNLCVYRIYSLKRPQRLF